jgi:biopolymer transport protein ExbD
MKIRQEANDEAEVTINLTPMIDMVFQLVIFFMLATNFVQLEKEMDVDLPEAESGTVSDDALDEIVVNVMKDGRLILSGREVDEAQLSAALQTAAQKEPKPPVTIRGDKDVNHGRIVAVMDACGVAGLTQLDIGTLSEG